MTIVMTEIDNKIYTTICAIFTSLIVLGNLIYQKFVTIPIFTIHSFELSVGALTYPFTFFLTDLIAEFYGKDRASFCVKLALTINIMTALIVMCMDQLNATDWSNVDNFTFHRVFGMYGISFTGSIFAYYIAQLVDIRIYLWIRKITNERFLWLRNNVSTALSLYIDTFIVISFMTYFEVLPIDKFWLIIINSYLFKLFFTILSTPIFYANVFAIKLLKKRYATM